MLNSVVHSPFTYIKLSKSTVRLNWSSLSTEIKKSQIPWSPDQGHFYASSSYDLTRLLGDILNDQKCEDALISSLCSVLYKSFEYIPRSYSIQLSKLSCGQYIDLHNDFNDSGYKYRFVTLIDHNFDGGSLVFFNEKGLTTFSKEDLLCNGILFKISENSFHKVTKVSNGERISLLITFK